MEWEEVKPSFGFLKNPIIPAYFGAVVPQRSRLPIACYVDVGDLFTDYLHHLVKSILTGKRQDQEVQSPLRVVGNQDCYDLSPLHPPL